MVRPTLSSPGFTCDLLSYRPNWGINYPLFFKYGRREKKITFLLRQFYYNLNVTSHIN